MPTRLGYLLDTNVVSEMMRAAPDRQVTQNLDRLAAGGLGLATITIWEIFNGIGKLPEGRRRRDLGQRFEAMISGHFAARVVDWPLGAAQACAQLMESRRRRGEPLDDHLPDAMLAGVARHYGLTVVTRNVSEFRHTGVDFLNPWTA